MANTPRAALEPLALYLESLEARVALLEPPASAPGWACDWTQSPEAYGFYLQAADPSRLTRSQGVVRLLTMPGDSNVAGSGANERCDLRLSDENSDCVEGREQWWSHVVVFPHDYVDPPPSPASAQPWNFGAVFDFHNSSEGAGQANFQIAAMPVTATSPDRPTGLNLQMAWGSQAKPSTRNYPIGPIVRATPYAFEHHVLWGASNGYFDSWLNGVLVMQYRGPTLYPGQHAYLKLANYHTPHGQASAVLHGPVKRGATRESVA